MSSKISQSSIIESQKIKLDQQQEVIQSFQDKIIFQGVWRSCLGCINFSHRDEQCMMFKARPPAKVIVHGCRDYDQDIPF